MMAKRSVILGAALTASFGLSAPAAATSAEMHMQAIDRAGSNAPAAGVFAQFAPSSATIEHRIDYSYLDEALGFIVIPMGPSVREGAPTVEPSTGTRRIYGHQSRYRLEGNRVAFSIIGSDVRQSLTEYRADLEKTGNTLDLARLPRNEQLAFWLNLHNVAVLEALADEYPLTQPSKRKFGSNRAALDDAKLVTIKGVALSPRDIREKIVYPNWQDPKVIYGFWRGEIGGPSLQRLAFNGQNLNQLLALSGEEFVNSLRGVERFGGALRVSRIYEEAAPFYFDDFAALHTHLAKFARDDVKSLIARSDKTKYNFYENDLADLARGERDSSLSNVGNVDLGTPLSAGSMRDAVNLAMNKTRVNPAIQRLMTERGLKLNKAYRRGIRTGTVTLSNVASSEAGAKGNEVK